MTAPRRELRVHHDPRHERRDKKAPQALVKTSSLRRVRNAHDHRAPEKPQNRESGRVPQDRAELRQEHVRSPKTETVAKHAQAREQNVPGQAQDAHRIPCMSVEVDQISTCRPARAKFVDDGVNPLVAPRVQDEVNRNPLRTQRANHLESQPLHSRDDDHPSAANDHAGSILGAHLRA